MKNKTVNQPEKLIFFIMGEPGSGKTVLAHELKAIMKGKVKIFEDVAYHPKLEIEVVNALARVRHTGDKIIICTIPSQYLAKRYDFRENHYITWFLTSMSGQSYYFLESLGIDTEIMAKFAKSWRNSVKGKTKTRPWISITRDPLHLGRFIYESGRYKMTQEIFDHS